MLFVHLDAMDKSFPNSGVKVKLEMKHNQSRGPVDRFKYCCSISYY